MNTIGIGINIMVTQKQKAKNQKYILDNLDKCVIDSRGNFVHVDSDLMGSENAELYFISREAVIDNREIVKKMASKILEEKQNWEVILDSVSRRGDRLFIKNKVDKRIIYGNAFGYYFYDESRKSLIDLEYKVMGELGYQQGFWKNYGEYKKQRKERQNSQTESPQTPEPKTSDKPNQQPPKSNNPPLSPTDNPKKDNSSPNKVNNNPSNSKPSLPSPADIQNSYNSDKAKTEITNNSNLTDKQAKQKAEALLKITITAELISQKGQFNQEILTKLLNEKKQNTPLYQLLNKEKRIDKVISQLEKLTQQNNPATDNNSFPAGIIILLFSFSFLIVGIRIIALRKKFWKRKLRSR